ncbi:lipopolysaccharide kinase InaA family protein [Methylophaga sp. OBS1]|uniref:lipopolysaccharide kinase InaA family protein n=1 Tax=Methylophaga sp. OBS1 TaxID=2991933 RepID=UPI00224C9CF4|nr:lipopolysaccharide kinase InaA family protein [Methylophaga sp. OBS1]MCX4193777.1 lipopolysaccharide kinase InaA family protein [Methylophaga sp. OBS1]
MAQAQCVMNDPVKQFLAGEQVPEGFVLEVDGEQYHCERVLRWLPGQRLVVRALHQGAPLLLKLFAPNKKGWRELSREQHGYKACKAAGIRVPAEKLISDDFAGCLAVAYEFIADASPFKLVGANQAQMVPALLQLMVSCHQAGIYQHDIHTDNMLMTPRGLVLIDLASVRGQPGVSLNTKKSLNNIARLLAQFVPEQQQLILTKLNLYYQARGWVYGQAEREQFKSLLNKAWQKRKDNYLSKCFRPCTMTAYDKDNHLEYAVKRAFFDQIGDHAIRNINTFVEQGEKLKQGNSATVVVTEMAERQVVIKRYNIKSHWHFLKRFWRPSRAANAWRQGNLLALLGIPTPTVLGFVEKRFGPFRKQAYLITEYRQGAREISEVYRATSPSTAELNQLHRIFSLMRDYQLSHGDLKASNLLMSEVGEIELIDLDAMTQHRCAWLFRRAFARDQKRFLRNWQGKALYSRFKLMIENLAQ